MAEPGNSTGEATPATPTAAPDPDQLLRSRSYLVILGLSAVIGVPVALAAFGFLQLVSVIQKGVFDHLPHVLGYGSAPSWWGIPVVGAAGGIVGLSLRYVHGNGGHSPADGLSPGAPTIPDLPGIVIAATVTLGLGVVLGPEAPLIAIGGGLGLIAVRLARQDAPQMAYTVIAAAGSFAALGTIFGSPLLAAFFLMEAVGVGGAMLSLILLPGLLASGIGALVSVGMGRWTGLGTFSLALPHLPGFTDPTFVDFCWAVAVGLASALLSWAIRRLALYLRPFSTAHLVTVTPLMGVVIGALALVFALGSGRSAQDVLFSGQTFLGPLVSHAAAWSLGALALLIGCKVVAYGVSLSSFRGGPIFPALFIGAAGGILLSHLPGFGLVPGLACGLAGMSTGMLRLPLSSAMLAGLLLASEGLAVDPLIVVTVAVAYVTVARLSPVPATTPVPAAAVA
ncbi:MAG: chloride channel protein [Acidimicrobiales bacterium]